MLALSITLLPEAWCADEQKPGKSGQSPDKRKKKNAKKKKSTSQPKNLKKAIIPHIEISWDKNASGKPVVPFDKVIKILQSEADKLDLGINIKYEFPAGSPLPEIVNLILSKCSFSQLVEHIEGQTGTVTVLKGNNLTFYPREHLFTRTYIIRVNNLLKDLKMQEEEEKGKDLFLVALESHAVNISTITSIKYGKDGKTITITAPLSTHEQLRFVEREDKNRW